MASVIYLDKKGRKEPIFTLTKGDAKTKNVRFMLPADDGETAIDSLIWMISIHNAGGKDDATKLQKIHHEDHIHLNWQCGWVAAAEEGITTIQIIGYNEDGDRQWSSGEYCILVNPLEDTQIPKEDITELQELIADAAEAMETATQETMEATQRADEAAEAADEARLAIADELNKKAPVIFVDASGDTVHIKDGAEGMPVQALITNIAPAEDGSGWDSVSVTCTGKNFINVPEKTAISYGVTLTVQNDVVTMDGAATIQSSNMVALGKVALKPGIYTLSHKILSGNVDGAPTNGTLIMLDQTQYRTRYNDPEVTFTVDAEKTFTINIMCAPMSAVYDNFTFSMQIEKGDAHTDFEPYNSQTLTAELPETVTEGVYDWVNGVLTKPDGSTVQLTPQQMETLKGVNNIWSNAGETTVTYAADTKLYIDNKIAAIAAAIVNG